MISIIIPSYNQAEYLPDAIDSVLNQTNKADEIFIIDDGSTDGSLEIAKKYERDNRNVFVVSQVNKGLASARNTGVMNASEDYVLFLDADDILLPTALEKIIEVIGETDADIIAPSFKEFGISNQEVILMPNPTLEDFKTANRIGYCAAIRLEALLEVGGYNPKMTFAAEDYDLWFDLLKRGAIIKTIPEVLWLYRVKKKSMWTEAVSRKEEFMSQIYKNHPDVFPEKQENMPDM